MFSPNINKPIGREQLLSHHADSVPDLNQSIESIDT